MQVFGIQLDIAWEDRDANFTRVGELLEREPPEPGSLIVLPEMFASGFSMNAAKIREAPDGPTGAFLSKMARRCNCWIMAGTVHPGEGDKARNTAVVMDEKGKEIAAYAKLFPFTFGEEGEHYRAGEAIVTVKREGWTIAPFICYDLRFPEIFRRAAMRGANLFVVIANWPRSREHHWMTLLKARAIENQAYVIGVNRCGEDPNYSFSGRSLIVDPQGETLADAGETEGLISARLDLDVVSEYRRIFPALRDIREEFLPTGK